MSTQPNWDQIMETPNNAARVPLPPSEFAFSPRAPSLKTDAQGNKTRSQADNLMSPRPIEHPMVRFLVRSLHPRAQSCIVVSHRNQRQGQIVRAWLGSDQCLPCLLNPRRPPKRVQPRRGLYILHFQRVGTEMGKATWILVLQDHVLSLKHLQSLLRIRHRTTNRSQFQMDFVSALRIHNHS
jgi:hypothetical protein